MVRESRVVMLGWDGATWDLILPWIEQGKLPGIGRMVGEGVWGTLLSTIPPISPSAWTTIFTGVNPGKHGILGFVKRKPDSYFVTPISSRDRKGVPVWTILSTIGKRVVLVNIPFTYPPDQVNGIMITGLGTPSKKSNFVYPLDRKATVVQQFPDYDVDFSEDRILLSDDKSFALDEIKDVTAAQIRLFTHLLHTEEWDFASVVFRSLDVAQHFFWDDPDCILQYYQQLDDLLSRCLSSCMQEGDSLLVCSDHGFSRVHTQLYVNNWLESLGLLAISEPKSGQRGRLSAETFQNILLAMGMKGLVWRLKRSALLEPVLKRFIRSKGFQHLLDMRWTETCAYFHDGSDGLVWLNLEGREPEGIVSPERKKVLQERIIQAALQIRDPSTGKPVIGAAYAGDDLFGSGGQMTPDIALLPNQGYRLVGGYNRAGRMFEEEQARIANHAPEGIFAAFGPLVRKGEQVHNARVADITPTILRMLGFGPPGNMDGKALDIFLPRHTPQDLSALERKSGSAIKEDTQRSNEFLTEQGRSLRLSKEDEEILEEKLAALGYMD
jgi:predicted AlkP superfamily phosphohydrolase/phosphomutase